MSKKFTPKSRLTDVSKNVLRKRYYHDGETKWKHVVERVTNHVCRGWDEDDKSLMYDIIYNRYFLPNSPTLVNAGKTKNAGLSACVPSYVKIPTNEGMIPISDVVNLNRGEFVLDGSAYTKINGRQHTGKKSVYRICTERGHTLDLTGDHLVLTHSRKAWNSVEKWTRVDEIEEGDILEFDSNEKIFGKSREISSDISTLIGYLFSDGCFTLDGRNDSGGNRVVEFIVNSVKEEELVCSLIAKTSNSDTIHIDRRGKYTRLRAYGNDRFRYLEKYEPFFGGAFKIPDELFQSPKNVIGNFLSAMFSADGYVSVQSKGCVVGISMINEGAIRDVGRLLSMFGIRYSITSSKDIRKDYDRKTMWTCTISDKHSHIIFRNDIGFFNEDKMNKLSVYLLENPLLKNQEHKYNLKLKVKTISDIGKFDVYDIETDSHRFISDNFVVHNCFVLPMDDTIEDIIKTKGDFLHIARSGGGCGTTLSNLRPKGDPVNGSTHGYAGGGLAFGNTISVDAKAMTQSGFREMALMFTFDVRHPDILEFITAKTEEGLISNANISVMVDDDFMRKVESGENYWTEFNGEKYKELNAREVFDMIVEGAWRNGEPGLGFIDTINNNSPYRYNNQRLEAMNPCG